MIKEIGGGVSQGEFIEINDIGASDSGLTRKFSVLSMHGGGYLGEIRWFGRWRKYCFFPAPDTAFEQVCMRDIAEFIEAATKKPRG